MCAYTNTAAYGALIKAYHVWNAQEMLKHLVCQKTTFADSHVRMSGAVSSAIGELWSLSRHCSRSSLQGDSRALGLLTESLL